MLLLFNKIVKPLNQFAKKNKNKNKKKIQKKSPFLGLLLTIFFAAFDKIFSQFFFLLHTSFYEP